MIPGQVKEAVKTQLISQMMGEWELILVFLRTSAVQKRRCLLSKKNACITGLRAGHVDG